MNIELLGDEVYVLGGEWQSHSASRKLGLIGVQ